MKDVPIKDHEEVLKIYSGCIKRSTTKEQREKFKEIKGYEMEDAIYAMGDEDAFVVNFDEKKVPIDMVLIMRGCYNGTRDVYYREKDEKKGKDQENEETSI
jgi:hypothetical protein